MRKFFKDFALIFVLAIVPTIFVWLPFFLKIEKFWTIPLGKEGMATVISNYDGPLYIVVAKTLYNTELIKQMVSFPLPVEYYAAHFPLYPILIRFFSFLVGFPYASLLVTLLSSILCLYFFFKLTKDELGEKKAKILLIIFSIFPARWLITRSIASPEPLFMTSIIASVYYFNRKEYFKSGIWGVLSQLTKSPGILLFLSLAGSLAYQTIKKTSKIKIQKNTKVIEQKSLWILLIPISLICLFFFYGLRFNDYMAYFNSGDNIHLFFPPFQVFNYSATWVGTFWLEEIILIYIFGGWGIINLFKQKRITMALVSGFFFISILFVSHRDIGRYFLPAVPFLLIAYEKTITKKEFKIILALIAIPIYLFTLAFISQNKMPIADWGPLL